MSIGNPKKLDKLSKLKEGFDTDKLETAPEAIGKVYKDKNYEAKKALKFRTDNNESKLA